MGELLALLHLEDVDRGHVNLKGKRNALDVYVKNAITLHRSLVAQGWRLRVLSDAAPLLAERAASYGLPTSAIPAIEPYRFSLAVPAGIRFRGAHFRFELFDAIARGEFGEEAGLIDIDCAAIGPLPRAPFAHPGEILVHAMNWGEAGWRKFGPDIERLAGFVPSETLWYGGEFLYGRAETFGLLAERFRQMRPVYAADPRSFKYVGMEMVLTALLHSTPGVRAVESDAAGLLTRWWSRRTSGGQAPLAEIAQRIAILHLPGDKVFLEGEAVREFDRERFLARYRRYLLGRIALGHLSNITAPLNRGGVKPVPRLA